MIKTESVHVFTGNRKTYVFATEADHSKAMVLLVHGLGEHVRRYDQQLDFFAKNGYSTLAADLPGHGRSEGKRGVWLYAEEHYKVVDGLMSLAKSTYPHLPVILYGHSMGGNLAAGYVQKRSPEIKGLILTGSAIKTPKDMPGFIVNTVLKAPHFIQNMTIANGLNLKSLCSDSEIVEKYKRDPLVHARISLGGGSVILANAAQIISTPYAPPFPVLIMHGADDKITFPQGSSDLASLWKGNVTLKIWPGMLHEIHNETGKLSVWEEMIRWMNTVIDQS
jgi:alpha-beta hydrolase superfamily lysophospholipase